MASGSEYGTGHVIGTVLPSVTWIKTSLLSENLCIVASVSLAGSDAKPLVPTNTLNTNLIVRSFRDRLFISVIANTDDALPRLDFEF